MANEEQLAILKQGIEAWINWCRENEPVEFTPHNANFLEGPRREAKRYDVDLEHADLVRADLYQADLRYVDLKYANLVGANLYAADLYDADLAGANLMDADLVKASLNEADLSGVNLVRAQLGFANFEGAILRGTDFSESLLGSTIFIRVDLSEAIGLKDVRHALPSMIDRSALQQSKGKISEAFLRGCGLSDWEIESAKLYNPDLTNDEIAKIQYRIYELRATQALQISPLFISYSHADKPFVDKMDAALTKKGVRFWRDIHDATTGRLETQIDRAIRQNPTVLLVLSKNSIKSDWVEHEVRTARELEKELGRDALCPIALDDSWKSSPWPKRVMEQVMEYNILDFSKWEDDSVFEEQFGKLLNGLDLFYKKSK